jgi:hypothetical protein
MLRDRARLDELLSAALPGFVLRDESQGQWQPAGTSADWKLEPDGDAFWLIVTGHTTDPMARSHRWQWPLKAVRQGPAGPWSWCAELKLRGRSQDAEALSQRISSIERWLAEGGVRGNERRSKRESDAPPSEVDAQLLAEAFGNGLEPRGRPGYHRLPVPDGPAVEFRRSGDGDGWRVDCILARSSERLPSPSLAALRDFLGVANARIHGCRAVLESGPEFAAVLECRIPGPAVTPLPLQEAAAIVIDAGQLLAPACQILCEIPEVGTAYAACLLGGEIVRV